MSRLKEDELFGLGGGHLSGHGNVDGCGGCRIEDEPFGHGDILLIAVGGWAPSAWWEKVEAKVGAGEDKWRQWPMAIGTRPTASNRHATALKLCVRLR